MGHELPVLKAREVVRMLVRAGFVEDRQEGSHLIFAKGSKTVVVPMHRGDMATGTLRSIIRQSGMEVDDFLKLR